MNNQLLKIGILLIVATCASTAVAGKAVYVGQKTTGQRSFDQIDHSVWNGLLKKYVDSDGYVNYTRWNSSQADRRALSGYLANLSTASSSGRSTKDAKLAFWINAYNAVTVEGILREYPTSSIRNHTAKVVGYNIWKDLHLLVGGKAFSLDSIEHKILRKEGDPRIHFAIVCASVGCPRLLNQAYTATAVQQQLDLNARDFFSRPQNFRYDQRSQSVQLSSILDWFGEDFGPNQQAQLRTISRWVPANAQSAVQSGRLRVSFADYSWDLNDQKRRGAVAGSQKRN